MLLNQRDVVEVNFNFPDGITSIHPVIVLSVQAVTSYENTFIGIPISHSATHNENAYSFPLYNVDFDKPLKYADSHARLHLISVIREIAFKLVVFLKPHRGDILVGSGSH